MKKLKVSLFFLILSCIFIPQSFACGSFSPDVSGAFKFAIYSKASHRVIPGIRVRIVSGAEQFKTVRILNTCSITNSEGKITFRYEAKENSSGNHDVNVSLERNGHTYPATFHFSMTNGKTSSCTGVFTSSFD